MPVCEREITPEEIVRALNIIRDVCKQHRCVDCPLICSNGDCGIVDSNREPEDWLVNPPNVWRAF